LSDVADTGDFTSPDALSGVTEVATATPIGTLEACLDLVLAEELSVNPEFATRFGSQALSGLDPPVNIREAPTVTVEFNRWDIGGDGSNPLDAGENDLDVCLGLDEGSARLLIEDKVWAPFQPEQGRRYRARADTRPSTAAVLVAPRSRLGDREQTHWFHTCFAIEDLGGWLREQANGAGDALARRLRWRANLLSALCEHTSKPDHPPTVAFTTLCAEWLATNAPAAIADTKSLRTAGTGWLYFAQPKGLIYKVTHGRVDVYVSNEGFAGGAEDLRGLVTSGGAPDGFVAAEDSKSNVVLRWTGTPLTPSRGIPEDRTPLISALEACRRATDWIASKPSALQPLGGA
jgi:hypothetical protein